MTGIDRQIRDVPGVVLAFERFAGLHVVDVGHALLDGILVRAGEGGEDEVTDVGLAVRQRHAVGELVHAPGFLDVGEIEFGVDALGEHVECDGHHVDIAGALTVAEERALDPVGASHHAELGSGDTGAAIVVRVQRENDRVAVLHVAQEAFDHVGVEVGGRHLDRRRQVEDQRVVRGRLDDVHDGLADLDGEVGFGAGVGLGRVLEADALRVRVGIAEFLAELGALDSNVDDAGPVGAEHDATLGGRGRVVEVHDGALGAFDRFEGAADEVFAALGEDLDGDTVGNEVFFDQLTHEVEVGL